jgi:PQQ-dependent catabolism-associated CXXCW motif protein
MSLAGQRFSTTGQKQNGWEAIGLERFSRTQMHHLRSASAAVLTFAVALIVVIVPALELISEARAAETAPNAAVEPVPEPSGYRGGDYRSPVPQTLRGATVLSSQQATVIWSAKKAIFIDVYPHAPKPGDLPPDTLWRETTHQSIEDAVWLPNVGYGVLSAATDAYFRRNLEALTHGDKAKPIVFFCLRNCWMSWNAAKRAMSYGYSNVDWYRDGTDGWLEIGGLVEEAHPLP